MDDLISRKAAIEAAYQGLQEPAHSERWERILGNLKAVPSVKQWIPCSERLPDKEKFYLTFGDKGYISILTWCDGWNCHTGYDGKVCREFEIKHIIAWQPLPEPYVEVKNETD